MADQAELREVLAELERLDALFHRQPNDPPGEARLLNEEDPEGPVVVTTARRQMIMPRDVYEDLKNFKPEGGST